MKTTIHMLTGYFGKVITADGRTVARAYAQADGKWRLTTAGQSDGVIVDIGMVAPWLAMQALFAE